ncbi:murein L,D-transpeptidase YcbB/YkuD [Algoriphagus aquaeductus]|uniref:Murein L,D-transpeptidase YcbB/YkuD n=1 Tax=Algoriphagus aquaeductus TaxID=475299 RepID=A0A326RVL7_9BACT|nr:L,D-transpeptidase family protein [Algoriphagus aquaeductus]PZV84434.1 murein L,D-transpeptidase YcbB/YkuD [Algoriphagus aquaeductus]
MYQIVFSLLLFFNMGFTTGESFFFSSVSDRLRAILENSEPGESLRVRGISLGKVEELQVFYSNRSFDEAWSEQGILTEWAYELRFEIKQAQFDGLQPKDYHIELIDAFFASFEQNKKSKTINPAEEVAELDLLLTDAFFRLATHLERGKVDPSQLKSPWDITRKSSRINAISLLVQALERKEIRKSLEQLYPNFSIYKRGREVIRSLDEKAKEDSLDWKVIKVDKSLKVNDSHAVIPVVRERLIFWGYLKPYSLTDPKKYDSTLFESVKAYQVKNGMEPDGAIGKNTVASLNASPRMLMDKASINLERLRWLPDTIKEAELVLVNIANYRLDYIQRLDTLFSSKVIVGKSFHASPIFSSPLTYLVFSPYWNIPASIARNEIIPSVRKNPNYLEQKRMEVVTTAGKPVDPSQINWSSKNFPYLIRQKPGPDNSLGSVKFMFPNKYSVYIHDTPSKSLFLREDRALSHGCIRLQNPEKFAALLLRDQPQWTEAKIKEAMSRDSELIVNLKSKIPVVLVYLTFWADSKGEPHFRPDIYNRDAELIALLKR